MLVDFFLTSFLIDSIGTLLSLVSFFLKTDSLGSLLTGLDSSLPLDSYLTLDFRGSSLLCSVFCLFSFCFSLSLLICSLSQVIT